VTSKGIEPTGYAATLPRTRRTYTYLMWSHAGIRHELLLSEATARTRDANLDHAWKLVHDHALLTPAGRERWPRAVTPPETEDRK